MSDGKWMTKHENSNKLEIYDSVFLVINGMEDSGIIDMLIHYCLNSLLIYFNFNDKGIHK